MRGYHAMTVAVLVLSSHDDKISQSGTLPCGISDHLPIFTGLDINACPTARGKLEVGLDKLFQKELAQEQVKK